MKFQCLFYLIVIGFMGTSALVQTRNEIPTIGIIGAGIGGVSTAYFLQQLFGEDKCKIDIYEYDKVGGRLRTTTVAGYEYEEGGTIIHPRNRYLKEFSELLGLEPKNETSGTFGLYDGKKFVFVESTSTIVTFAKLFYRYGFNMIRMELAQSRMLDKFDRIYKAQDRHEAFLSVTDLLRMMDPSFIEMTQVSSRDGFHDEGFGELFMNEIIMAALMVNYGQNLSAHHFVGSVSMAGADSATWSTFNGNRQVPEKLLHLTTAKLISQKVKEVTLLENGAYSIMVEASEEKVYDIVVLAAPLAANDQSITFKNLPNPVPVLGSYHITVNTLVNGKLNGEYFGWKAGKQEVTQVLVVKDGLFFNSVAKVMPINYTEDHEADYPEVWKVFSREELTSEQLALLFTDIKEVHVRKWRAYPHYSSKQRLGDFVLHPNLYHVNVIEWVASAMEMSCLGAKNVALLAHKNWVGAEENTDVTTGRQEL